jgi:hypothetical protein
VSDPLGLRQGQRQAPIRETSQLRPDEHEPYLDLLEWIFGGVGEAFPPMSAERRIAWMQNQLPQTYARMSLGHRWLELSALK